MKRIDPDTPLEELYKKGVLSTRAYNALSQDFTTLRGAYDTTDGELLRIPNFGKTSLREVKELLAKCPPKKPVDPVIAELRLIQSRLSALESSIGILRKKLAEHQDDLLFLFRGFKR